MGRWEEASSDLSESQKGAKLGEGVRADVEGPVRQSVSVETETAHGAGTKGRGKKEQEWVGK